MGVFLSFGVEIMACRGIAMATIEALFGCDNCGHHERVVRDLLDNNCTCPRCGQASWAAYEQPRDTFRFRDPIKEEPPPKNLPKPTGWETQTCRNCEREFIPTLDHKGFIDVCPSCSGVS
jgi:hypothetical protein